MNSRERRKKSLWRKLRYCHSIYLVRLGKTMHTLVGIAYFQSKTWTHCFSNPADHEIIWGDFYRGDCKTKLFGVDNVVTSLWMEYRHNLYSPNITTELGTLSKHICDSAGRCCNSVPRSGLKDNYIFSVPLFLRQPANMPTHCTTKEYDISRCHAEWSASEAVQAQKLRDVSVHSTKSWF